jgi:hypothetical protein
VLNFKPVVKQFHLAEVEEGLDSGTCHLSAAVALNYLVCRLSNSVWKTFFFSPLAVSVIWNGLAVFVDDGFAVLYLFSTSPTRCM